MRSILKNIFGNRKKGAMILMYHRIASAHIDPWDLCVSPEYFEEQVRYISDNFQVVTVHELTARARAKQSLREYIAITFDDGYRDNFTAAKPILEKYNVPATFYLNTRFTAKKKSFWWDELEQLILATPILPEKINLHIGQDIFSADLGPSHILSDAAEKEISEWHYGHPLYNARLKLFYDLWAAIRPTSIAEQQQVIHELQAWANVDIAISLPALMDEEQIKALSNTSLFEIGAHTLNHPALGHLLPDEQRYEIKESKSALEAIINKPITGFAYPYGDLNEHTPGITQHVGFDYAVSTREGNVIPDGSLYDLPRYQVKNIRGKEFSAALHTWQQNIV
jgi:peptidoglycan/xylan/chitin deacetylase (PgdA/CDA1 family)